MEKVLKGKKVLIAGAPKTATTALYFRVKDSLSNNHQGFFEPKDLESCEVALQSNVDVVAKIVLIQEFSETTQKILSQFNKNLLIIRDPRDTLISSLLYEGGYHSAWKKSVDEIADLINILKQKEEDPSSISVVKLWDLIAKDSLPIAEFVRRLNLTITFLQQFPDSFVVRYEDFVQNQNIENLEKYLELSLNKKSVIPSNLKRVIRTKSSGNWQAWFTAEDIDYFDSIFSDYMEAFQYKNISNTIIEDRIDPKYCSEYFTRLVNEKRKLSGMEPIAAKPTTTPKPLSFITQLFSKLKLN